MNTAVVFFIFDLFSVLPVTLPCVLKNQDFLKVSVAETFFV